MDYFNGARIMVRKETMDFGLEFILWAPAQPGDSHRRVVAHPSTFEPHKHGSLVQPTFTLDYTSSQELMDELWRNGIRPSEGAGSAGAMAATERHLKDLQRLVFKGKS